MDKREDLFSLARARRTLGESDLKASSVHACPVFFASRNTSLMSEFLVIFSSSSSEGSGNGLLGEITVGFWICDSAGFGLLTALPRFVGVVTGGDVALVFFFCVLWVWLVFA